MKRKNDFFQGTVGGILIIVLLIAVALWAAFNLLRTGDESVQQRVSVIVEDSNNECWTAFRTGLDQAAAEYGVDVTFVSSTGFSNAEEQKNLIAQEAASGTEALIPSLYDSEETDIAPGTMKLVYVETDGIRDNSAGTAAVIPSGSKMGKALGDMILSDSGLTVSEEGSESMAPAGNGQASNGQGTSDSSGEGTGDAAPVSGGKAPSVAILIGNLRRYAQKEMLRGLTETVEAAGGTIWPMETEGKELSVVMEMSDSCDFIAVLEDTLLVQAASLAEQNAAQAAPEGSDRSRLYGIGCSPSSISYLDRGVISGMIVPNEFSMGYQSLSQLSQCLSNDIPAMKDIEVGFTSVRSDEVHTKANEKLLFLPIR